MVGQKESITVLSAINVRGETIPNFYIFKGIYVMRIFVSLCEKEAIMAMQPNAWMIAFFFSKWMDYFLVNVEKTGNMSPT